MCLLDKDFPFGLDDKLIDLEKMRKMGLQFLGEIRTDDLYYESLKLKEFIKYINESINLDKNHVWAMFGRKEPYDQWLPLQVASRKNIKREISADLKCMIPFDETRDFCSFKSDYYGTVMRYKAGFSIGCLKYRKVAEKCSHIGIAIFKDEEKQERFYDKLSAPEDLELRLAEKLKPLLFCRNPRQKDPR